MSSLVVVICDRCKRSSCLEKESEGNGSIHCVRNSSVS